MLGVIDQHGHRPLLGKRLPLDAAIGIDVAMPNLDRLTGQSHHTFDAHCAGLTRLAEGHDLPSPRRTQQECPSINQHPVAGQIARGVQPVAGVAAIGADARQAAESPAASQAKQWPQSAQTTSRCVPKRVSAIDPPTTWHPQGKPSKNQARRTNVAESSKITHSMGCLRWLLWVELLSFMGGNPARTPISIVTDPPGNHNYAVLDFWRRNRKPPGRSPGAFTNPQSLTLAPGP